MGNSSENLRENNQAKPKTKEEKMALNINSFSPFSMRSAFDNSFFSNRWNDDWSPQQEPRQPVQGIQELVQQGGGQGGGGQLQDGGQDQRLRVQAGGFEGLRAIRKTSRGRKARGEEGGRQRLRPEELLKEVHPALGGGS